MGYREYIFPTLITVGLLLIIYLLAYVGTILETEKYVHIHCKNIKFIFLKLSIAQLEGSDPLSVASLYLDS